MPKKLHEHRTIVMPLELVHVAFGVLADAVDRRSAPDRLALLDMFSDARDADATAAKWARISAALDLPSDRPTLDAIVEAVEARADAVPGVDLALGEAREEGDQRAAMAGLGCGGYDRSYVEGIRDRLGALVGIENPRCMNLTAVASMAIGHIHALSVPERSEEDGGGAERVFVEHSNGLIEHSAEMPRRIDETDPAEDLRSIRDAALARATEAQDANAAGAELVVAHQSQSMLDKFDRSGVARIFEQQLEAMGFVRRGEP